MGERRVGFGVTSRAVVQEGEQKQLATRGFTQLTLSREGQAVTQTISIVCREDAAGKLLRFESTLGGGGGETHARGEVAGQKLLVENHTLGKTSSQESPINGELRGFFAVEQSLIAAPLKPGEKRSLQLLTPVVNLPSVVLLHAQDWEETPLRQGSARLLKIEQTLSLAGQTIQSFLWIDELGHVQKTFDPNFQQTSFRCSREEALAEMEAGGFDLMTASAAPVRGKIPDFSQVQAVEYLVRVTRGELAGVFASDGFQQTSEPTKTSIRLRIRRQSVTDQPSSAAAEPPPAAEYLEPNNLIQSDDPAIAALAAQVAADATEPLRIAAALEKQVASLVKKKNYSQAFASAAEVARSLEGDCTEHAVLLAALCRARKIPSRVVFGLVYYPPQQGFAYHMWNEVWAENRWVPLDATKGAGTVGPDHIKLSDSSLKGVSAYAAMLPVVQVFGRLELEIVAVQE